MLIRRDECQMITRLYDLEINCIYQKIIFPESDANYWISHEQFFLRIPGVALYQVYAPTNTIYIDPDRALTNPALIQTWLYGTVLAYLLQYHDYFVLHGSAIVRDNKAIVFTGCSGAGKSTLAMAMSLRGCPVITDDVIAIRYDEEKKLKIIPSKGPIKLWVDALEKLGRKADGLPPVLNKPGKFALPVEVIEMEPIPIAKVYELNHSDQQNDILLTEVKGMDAFSLLIKNTYRYSMLKPLGKLGLHLMQMNQLVQSISSFKIIRPSNSFQLDELISFIEAQIF